MPLNKSGSKEALSENIATEIAAGKSPEQAAAIAYSVQKGDEETTEGSTTVGDIVEVVEEIVEILSIL